MSDTPPAGWQPDPTGRHEHRYWDGATWTDNISDAGVAGTDPFTAPADTTAVWSTAPAPVAPTGSGGGGSPKTGLVIAGGILAIIAIAVVALLLSGNDDDEGDEVRTDPTVSTPTEVDDTTTDAVETPTTFDGGGTDGEEVPDEVLEQMATFYQSILGLSEEQAECLIDRQAGDIADRNLTPDEAATEIFGYLADCDISMADLGANG